VAPAVLTKASVLTAETSNVAESADCVKVIGLLADSIRMLDVAATVMASVLEAVT
jgi:hypothetical protein